MQHLSGAEQGETSCDIWEEVNRALICSLLLFFLVLKLYSNYSHWHWVVTTNVTSVVLYIMAKSNLDTMLITRNIYFILHV